MNDTRKNSYQTTEAIIPGVMMQQSARGLVHDDERSNCNGGGTSVAQPLTVRLKTGGRRKPQALSLNLTVVVLIVM